MLVVELAGAVDRATFMGDVTGLAIKTAGAAGVVIDGGLRDLTEFLPMKDFPVYYRGAHASAMADQIGVEWNVPVRIGDMTVLPGDVVIGDSRACSSSRPSSPTTPSRGREDTVYTETFKREMIAVGQVPDEATSTRGSAPSHGEALRGVEEDPPSKLAGAERSRRPEA